MWRQLKVREHMMSFLKAGLLLSLCRSYGCASTKCRFCHCDNVYLDVGSNIGVQVRKVYEPEKFPNAAVLPIFDERFGKNREKVCSVGFEPNPVHSGELLTIQSAYRERGLNVHFFTRTAVGVKDTRMNFYLDTAVKHKHWSASLYKHDGIRKNFKPLKVKVMNLANFINNEFNSTARLVMKMDIEGAEYVVLPSLLRSGAFCKLDVLFIEWHDHMNPRSSKWTSKSLRRELLSKTQMTSGCGVTVLDLDDEDFAKSSTRLIPLRHLQR